MFILFATTLMAGTNVIYGAVTADNRRVDLFWSFFPARFEAHRDPGLDLGWNPVPYKW